MTAATVHRKSHNVAKRLGDEKQHVDIVSSVASPQTNERSHHLATGVIRGYWGQVHHSSEMKLKQLSGKKSPKQILKGIEGVVTFLEWDDVLIFWQISLPDMVPKNVRQHEL